MDKKYQGADEVARAVTSKKKPKGGIWSCEAEDNHRKVTSDRIIRELFGRLCLLWNIIGNKCGYKESRYDPVIRLCVALTNIPIQMHPLRYDDGSHHGRFKKPFYSIGVIFPRNGNS